MDDPDQTAPVPRDDGGAKPAQPSRHEEREMVTGNDGADVTRPAAAKAIAIEDHHA